MQSIDPKQISDNLISLISKEWMLVTAGNATSFNTMTAAWGAMGYLWNRPVAFIFIRPERCEAYKICGSHSGRDMDKIQAAHLHPTTTPAGLVTFEESRLTLECKKIYATTIQSDSFIDPTIYSQWYGGTHGGDHKLYIGAINACYIR